MYKIPVCIKYLYLTRSNSFYLARGIRLNWKGRKKKNHNNNGYDDGDDDDDDDGEDEK